MDHASSQDDDDDLRLDRDERREESELVPRRAEDDSETDEASIHGRSQSVATKKAPTTGVAMMPKKVRFNFALPHLWPAVFVRFYTGEVPYLRRVRM
jgi:hypothetical protein